MVRSEKWMGCQGVFIGHEKLFWSKGDADYAFATVAVPFLLKAQDNCTFYQPASLTDGTLNFETVDGSTVTFGQGKAYLLKVTANTTVLRGPHDGYAKASPVDNGSGVTMKGTYTNIAAVPTDDYILSGTDLYKVNSTVTLAPFRAYFTIPSGAARIALSFDGVATGIETLNQSPLNVNQYFDLQGRRVAQPTKGLYIVNGKKVMVK